MSNRQTVRAVFSDPVVQLAALCPLCALAALSPAAALAALSPTLAIFNPAINPGAALLAFRLDLLKLRTSGLGTVRVQADVHRRISRSRRRAYLT